MRACMVKQNNKSLRTYDIINKTET